MKIVRRLVRRGEPSIQLDLFSTTALKVVIGSLMACAILSLAACQKAELKPTDIAENDTCFRCKGAIVDKHYAAELMTKDGFVRKFDDISCMLEHAKTKIGKSNIVAYYTMDFPTQTWVRAEEAHFVKSDKFNTPRNGGILSFKDQAKAQALASQYQAQLVTFKDLIQ